MFLPLFVQNKLKIDKNSNKLILNCFLDLKRPTLVILRVSQTYFRRGLFNPLRIINTEGHLTLNYYQYIGMDIFFPLIPK